MRRRIVALVALLVAVTAMVFAAGCSRSDTPITSNQDSIYHTWDWVESIGGFSGMPVHPDSVGYSETIVFASRGTYQVYQNDQLVREGEYDLQMEELWPESDEIGLVLTYSDGFRPRAEVKIDDDTLTLSDLIMDGYTRIFVKTR